MLPVGSNSPTGLNNTPKYPRVPSRCSSHYLLLGFSESIETTFVGALDAQLDTSTFRPKLPVGRADAKLFLRKWFALVELIGIEPTTS